MSTTKVLVLGGSGMLGAMVTDYLSRRPDMQVTATVRSNALAQVACAQVPEVDWRVFDVTAGEPDVGWIGDFDWVINCIGITKPLIRDDNPEEVGCAVRVNSLFPCVLHRAVSKSHGTRVIQIATDCVFSGTKGSYVETDPHDAWDAYGKTKSLGEVSADRYYHLRCSIIGPEPKERKFLLEWFLSQPEGGEVKGFVDHMWNGVTTLHFAKLCLGLITAGYTPPNVQHVVPSDHVTKCKLLEMIARCYGREDVRIVPTEASQAVDRTLSTVRPEWNLQLWRAAGYGQPPTILQMLSECAAFCLRLRFT